MTSSIVCLRITTTTNEQEEKCPAETTTPAAQLASQQVKERVITRPGSEADSLPQLDRAAANEGFPVGQARFSGNNSGNRQLLLGAATHGPSWKTTALGQKWTYRRGKNGGRSRRCEFHSRLRYFLLFFLFLAFLPLLQPTVLTVSVPVIL